MFTQKTDYKMSNANFHYIFEPDHRIEGLELIIIGLNKTLQTFKEKLKNYNYYDGDWYREETELIYGVLLVSVQNYINKTCYDFLEARILDKKDIYEYYDINSEEIFHGVSQIRLIIELANYFKHRDDNSKISKYTQDAFDKLKISDSIKKGQERFEDETIFNGMALLIKNSESLTKLSDIAKKWRQDTIQKAKNTKSM